jgi:hypothetical protein
MFFLGIDWATEKHDLCLLDHTGAILHQLTISQSNDGFEQLQVRVNIMEGTYSHDYRAFRTFRVARRRTDREIIKALPGLNPGSISD